jgi:hypothetical protein
MKTFAKTLAVLALPLVSAIMLQSSSAVAQFRSDFLYEVCAPELGSKTEMQVIMTSEDLAGRPVPELAVVTFKANGNPAVTFNNYFGNGASDIWQRVQEPSSLGTRKTVVSISACRPENFAPRPGNPSRLKL